MKHNATLLLTNNEIRQLIPHREFNRIVENVFLEWGRNNVVMPPKIHLDMSRSGFDSWNNAMPAFVVPQQAAGIKWVGGYKNNPSKGLPYIRSLLVVTGPENGDTLAIMDGTYISDWRTGATAAVAVKYLAKKDFSRVTVVGAGIQGRTAAACIHESFPQVRVTAADISEKSLDAFREEMKNIHGFEAKTTIDLEAACREADVIVLLTTASKPIVRRAWLSPGVLLLGMGSYQQADDDALLDFDRIIVDSRGQAAHRGELKNLVESGRFSENDMTAELGQVVAGVAPGRTSDLEEILCILVGLGAHDISAASEVYHRALEHGIGRSVNLTD